MQIIIICENTGQVINCEEFYKIGGLSKDEFKDICTKEYKKATLNLDYMDDPTIVGCIGVDFDLLKN